MAHKPAAQLLYVPDRIRLVRTDRLWHARDSHSAVFKRNMHKAWDDATSYQICQSLRAEIALIDQELRRRWMKLPKRQRDGENQETAQRYDARR